LNTKTQPIIKKVFLNKQKIRATSGKSNFFLGAQEKIYKNNENLNKLQNISCLLMGEREGKRQRGRVLIKKGKKESNKWLAPHCTEKESLSLIIKPIGLLNKTLNCIL
jgi:hypothetical protein